MNKAPGLSGPHDRPAPWWQTVLWGAMLLAVVVWILHGLYKERSSPPTSDGLQSAFVQSADSKK